MIEHKLNKNEIALWVVIVLWLMMLTYLVLDRVVLVEDSPIDSVVTETVETVESDRPEPSRKPIAKEVYLDGEAVPNPEPEEPVVLYYDVPLDEDLQDHIFAVCEEYRINPAIVFAIIERESQFDIDAIGDRGRSFGLMQVQKRWHGDRMNKLGVTNLLNPYQNVRVGIDYLAELFERCEDIEWVLMAYNGGPSYANRSVAAGLVSSYATGVLVRSRELDNERGLG